MHIGMVGGEKDDTKHVFVKAFATSVLSWEVPPILMAASIWAAFSKDMVEVIIKRLVELVVVLVCVIPVEIN